MTGTTLAEWISNDYLDQNHIRTLRQKFEEAKPFPHLILPHFLKMPIMEKLVFTLMTEAFEHKKSDLFSFHQTHDLSHTDNLLLEEFRGFLASRDCIEHIESLTGLALASEVLDLHGTLYEKHDYLLCHDDRLEGRKIAFMIYVSDLDPEEGGALVLLNSKNNEPRDVAYRIHPAFNTLVLFEVSDNSFHEVEEVLQDRQRLAFGGWWHGR